MVSLSIHAMGMVTPVGFTAAASCAAMRAGIRGVDAELFFDRESGGPIVCGRVGLPQWWEGPGKFPQLVAPAIRECLELSGRRSLEELPLLLCIAGAKRHQRWGESVERLLGELEAMLEIQLHPASRIVGLDNVGGAHALRDARDLLGQGIAPACIIAGVDSLLEQDVVDGYLSERRILTATNSNGFSPSEAGAAILVGPPQDGRRDELHILGMGFADEPAALASSQPTRGEGLTHACRAALKEAGTSMAEIDYQITDLNGEHRRFKEASFAAGRLLKERRPTMALWHPIEHIGEIGAAIGPCALGIALHAGQKAYAPGGSALLHFSNDDGRRAAIVTRYQPSART